jgi:hypothetical protein
LVTAVHWRANIYRGLLVEEGVEWSGSEEEGEETK